MVYSLKYCCWGYILVAVLEMLEVKNGIKLNIKPFSLYKNNYMIKMTQSFSLKVKFAF